MGLTNQDASGKTQERIQAKIPWPNAPERGPVFRRHQFGPEDRKGGGGMAGMGHTDPDATFSRLG